MPKIAKIPPAQRQMWLEEHDRGARIDDLARAANRTPRTVTTHIEFARREREQREVRGGLLREAMLRHMEDLLTLARRLQEADPGTQAPTLREPHDVTATLLLEALHRHLPRSPLWKARDQWVKAIADLATLRQSFDAHWQRQAVEALAGVLPDRTGIEWASGLWLVADRAAANQALDDMVYQQRAIALGQTLEQGLAWGSYDLLRPVPPGVSIDALQRIHEDLVAKVMAGHEGTAIAAVRRRITASRATVDREVEQLLLRRLLPGSCSLCQQ